MTPRPRSASLRSADAIISAQSLPLADRCQLIRGPTLSDSIESTATELLLGWRPGRRLRGGRPSQSNGRVAMRQSSPDSGGFQRS